MWVDLRNGQSDVDELRADGQTVGELSASGKVLGEDKLRESRSAHDSGQIPPLVLVIPIVGKPEGCPGKRETASVTSPPTVVPPPVEPPVHAVASVGAGRGIVVPPGDVRKGVRRLHRGIAWIGKDKPGPCPLAGDLIGIEALSQKVSPAEMIRRQENRPVGDRPLHRRTEQQRRLDPQADLIDPSGRERPADGSGRPLGGGRPGARPPLVPPREEVVVEVVAGGEPNAIDVIHVPRLSRWNRGRDQVTRIFPAKECGTRRVDDRRHLDVLHSGDRRPDVAIPRPDDLREDS